MSAGPAAARLRAPILLTTRDGLPPSTDVELRRLQPRTVVIAGGLAAVGPDVAALLAAQGIKVHRVSGSNRYATSAALSRMAAPVSAETVFVASGRDFADALSGAAPAAVHHAPILLVDPDGVSPEVSAELDRLRPREVIVLGGEGAVPGRIISVIEAQTGGDVRRLAGENRYVTNTRVSRAFYPHGADVIYIANGGRFADAMVVGAVASGAGDAAHDSATLQQHGSADGVLLYVADLDLPNHVERELVRLDDAHQRGEPEPEETESPPVTEAPSPSADPDDPPQNRPPNAVADGGVDFTTDEDTALRTPVLSANDSDPEGTLLTVTAIDTTGLEGSATLNGDGSVDYDPVGHLDQLAAAGTADDVFTYTVEDEAGRTATGTVTITVEGVNDAPLADLDDAGAGENATASFTEDTGAVLIAPTAAISDVDSAALTGATITITNDLDGAAESLAATAALPGGITAAPYDDTTGVLALSGTASVADYQAALRLIGYDNGSQNPTTTARSVTVAVTDGITPSTSPTSTVSITAVNDAPQVDLDSGVGGENATASFTEDAGAVLIAPTATVVDADSATLTGATITITNDLDGAAESLAATAALPGGITAAPYDDTTGVLALSGTASVADYQAALRLIGYDNTDNTPTTTARTVTVTVTDGTDTSTGRTSTVSVVAVNDAPTVVNDSYSDEKAFGNVLFVSTAGAETGAAAVAKTTHTLELLDNDSDPEGDSLSVTGISVTSGSGTATVLNPITGAYSYEPHSTGTHVLTYTVFDGTDTAQGTVTIDVEHRVWFLDHSGGAGAGRSTATANSLATVAAADAANDIVFVLDGSGGALTDGFVMEEGQQLLGEPNGLSLTHSQGGAQTLVTAGGSKPIIDNAGGTAITLASGVTVKHVQVTSAATGIDGSSAAATVVLNNVAVAGVDDGIILSGGTYQLTGGITVSSGTGTALDQDGGTLTVSGAGNTLAAAGGKALDLTGTTVTGGLTFQSISVTGGTNAVTFSPANGDGTLTVTGVATDTSGGTIQNVTGDAITVTAGNVSLSRMLIQNNQARGIVATGANSFSLSTVELRGNGDAATEHTVELTNVSGPISITNSEFYDGADDLLYFANFDVNATLTVSGTTFEDTDVSGGAKGVAIFVDGTSAVNATFTASSVFRNLASHALRWTAGTAVGSNGASSLTVEQSTFANTDGSNRHSGVDLVLRETTVTTVSLLDNIFQDVGDPTILNAGAIQMDVDGAATLRATISGNTIDDALDFGIRHTSDTGGRSRLLIQDNTITDSMDEAIWISNGTGTGVNDVDVTILNNTVTGAGMDAATFAAIEIESTEEELCADLRGNDVQGTLNSKPDIELFGNGGPITYAMPGTGAVTTADVAGRNTNVLDSEVSLTGTVNRSNDAPCVLPTDPD